MFSLAQQVSETNRHAIPAGAPLARRDPLFFPDGGVNIAGLKSRIKGLIDFLQSLPHAEIEAPRTGRWSLPSGTATSGNLWADRCC